ncbi:hypothetical protein APHAL10511_004614 [Amanita phalloides]|nr:hypothetical protein APHAL10511_004614 [Amanita phalloides]
MSLSSFLFTKEKARNSQRVDSELDELFKSKTYVLPPRVGDKVPKPEKIRSKKRKLDTDEKSGASDKKARKETRSNQAEKASSERDSDIEGSFSGQENSDDERGEGHSSDDEETNEVFDPSKLIHESLQKPKDKSLKAESKKKCTPPDETVIQRDLRTVFVGNLSVEVAKKRPLQKQLRRHILSVVPTAKIESVRFRSIPFQNPTTNLSTADNEPESRKAKAKDGREHDRTRAAAWRHSQTDKATDGGNKDEKKFLTPAQKKKIAFINHEYHPTADTLHAYIVFAHPTPPPSTTSSPKPPEAVMDPYEAAHIAARLCDGTAFMDRLLRVDVVGKTSIGDSDIDPKLTIFVGNLDFASKEEDLRVFFEGVVLKERGEPPPQPEDQGDDGDDDGHSGTVKKTRAWVTRVRIIRDRETQLGKGFAYIQFADRECVDEILALEEGKLKFAKRKLRAQKCKTIRGASISTKQLTADTHKSGKATPLSLSKSKSQQLQTKKSASKQGQLAQPPKPFVIPKGDPLLGDKLAHLSKEKRKQAKAADADRVARRLAKKKARITMDKDQSSEKRVRVQRKGIKDESKSGKKKGRVRSEKSIAKLNTKK